MIKKKKVQLKVYINLGCSNAVSFLVGKKVGKGARWTPWLSEAKKDVISCDKPRVGANDL